jgi:putative resolvase
MPVRTVRTPGGHYRVFEDDDATGASSDTGGVALYARVSSRDQAADLDRQADRLRAFAAGRGYAEVRVVTEVGSGLNGRRRKLLALLSDPSVLILVVEHRDRLARFGVAYLEATLQAQGRELVVVESGEQELDLVQDFVDVVTSTLRGLVARPHGSGSRGRSPAPAPTPPCVRFRTRRFTAGSRISGALG